MQFWRYISLNMNIGLTMIGFNYKNNLLKKTEIKSISVFNSPSWVRTNDPSVNSRMLYHWAIEEYLYSINPFVSFDKGFYLLFLFYVPSKLHTRNIFFHPTYHLAWSCPRPISISQLHTLLYFHLWPIYLVVFKGSYYLRRDISSWGGLHA